MEAQISPLEISKITEEIELLLHQFIRCSKDGVFDKKEQAVFLSLFDVGLMDKLVNFIRGLNKSEIQDAISKKIENTKSEIKYLIPDTYKEETFQIAKEIRSCFN